MLIKFAAYAVLPMIVVAVMMQPSLDYTNHLIKIKIDTHDIARFVQSNTVNSINQSTAAASITTTVSTSSISTTSTATTTSVTTTTPTTITLFNTTFIESGLPSGALWQLGFNGASSSAFAPNTIIFQTLQGNYPFLVQNSAVSNVVYLPSPAGGSLTAGSTQTVAFNSATTVAPTTTLPSTSTTSSSTSSSSTSSVTTTIPINALTTTSSTSSSSTVTTTLNTTVSTTSSSSSSSTTVKPSNIRQKIHLVTHLSADAGGAIINSNQITVYSNRSALNSFNVSLRNAVVANFSVTNSSQPPGSLSKLNAPAVFQYIQINGSANGGRGDNIDQFVDNVTYNFSVPASWLQQHNLGPGGIQLLKYYPSSKSWVGLPTNLTSSTPTTYVYSAVSNSLSTYAVTWVTGNTITAGASPLTLSLTSGLKSYFYVGAAHQGSKTQVLTANFITQNQISISGGNGGSAHTDNVIIGSNGVGLNAGELLWTAGASTTNDVAISGFGANLINPTGAISSFSAFQSGGTLVFQGVTGNVFTNGITAVASGTAFTLQYTTPLANSVVFLLGGDNATWGTVTLPAGCTLKDEAGESTFANTIAANCIQAAGSFTFSAAPATHTAMVSLAAYVFPPYNVMLSDYPATGNILAPWCDTCATAQQVNGNTVMLNGDGAVNAVIPTGGSFMGWFTDGFNAVNTIVNTPLKANTFISIMGNAIITAGYWPNTFGCGCLPYTIHSTSTNSITSSSNLAQVALTPGFSTYFYAGSANTATSSGIATANFIVSSQGSFALTRYGFIGYNTLNTANIMTSGTSENAVVVGIGANVIFTNNGFTRNNIGSTGLTSNLLFTVNTPFSYVVLGTAVTNAVLSPSSYALPTTCVLQQIGNTIIDGSAALATCNALPAGTYSVNVSLTNPGNIIQQAWVFPPYNAFLQDSPGTGNVLTNNTNQVNGNEITVIGDNTVNAIIPVGDSFSGWSVDSKNTVNVVFTSSSSANTFASIMGGAIITATYSAASCIPVITNTLITFPSTYAGGNAPTANAEKVTNGGTTNSNILIFGANWISATAAFHVSNTLWNPASSLTGAIGNELTNTAVDTQVLIPASAANTIFFGLNIPSGQAAATYNQAITVEASC